jgi:hypothetical protein
MAPILAHSSVICALVSPVVLYMSSEAPPQTIEVGGSAGVIVRAGSSS